MMAPLVLDLDNELTRTSVHEAAHALIHHYYCHSRVTGIRVSPTGVGRVNVLLAPETTPFMRAVAALADLAAEEVFGADCSLGRRS
jgi:hypothetical protein